MTRLRLLQVCNVGEIVGGTTACAWTVMRALPEFEHDIAFLTAVSAETRDAFLGIHIEQWPACTLDDVDRLRPDVVLLHNIVGRRRMSRRAVTLQYVHSAGRRCPADVTICCSRWLAREAHLNPRDVLYQGVPRPRRTGSRVRDTDGRFIVGRLCTPTAAKWPKSMAPFYAALAPRFPQIEWEFVGCPRRRRPELHEACGRRATFFPASWSARRRFWDWDVLMYHNAEVTESFGRTVAESMRAGCIPIVDARGGFLEQVTPETGFLCTTLDDFAASLDLLCDGSLRVRISNAAQQHADRSFSLKRFREQLLRRIQAAALQSDLREGRPQPAAKFH